MIFSPATDPRLPPRKLKSKIAQSTSMPSIRPLPQTTVSFFPVASLASVRRDL